MNVIVLKEHYRILITVSEGSITRNILRSFVLEKLLDIPELSVVLLVPEEKHEAYLGEFGSSRVSVVAYRSAALTFYGRLMNYLARNGLKTETILTDQKTHSKFGVKYLLKRALIVSLGSMYVFHLFIRLLVSFREPSGQALRIFQDLKPDLLFATDVQDEIDVDIMLVAKKTGTRIVGMVRSWDNLTSSAGLLQIVPDKLIVWNPHLYDAAVEVQHIPKSMITMVGIPHFDWYKKEEIFIDRETFARQVGLDPAKKIILFAGIGDFHAPHETEVAGMVAEALERGDVRADAQILFRPHPNFMVARERVLQFPKTVFDEGVAYYTGKDKGSWEMDSAKIAHLVNSLRHADIVITTASSMTIDAVAFGKPVICIGFDGEKDEPYYQSVRRYYRDFSHYIAMTKTKGFQLANNREELIRAINAYFENPQMDEEGRKVIFDRFIWKLGGSAERLVQAVLS